MRAEHVTAARRVPGLTPAERLVLAELTEHANADGTNAYPSRSRLCALTGLSDESVRRVLRRLLKLGYIGQQASAHRGKTRTFAVHPHRWPNP